MRKVSLPEFMSETTGGWPVRSDMLAYAGKEFECACGKKHIFHGDQAEVIRELGGMKFVFRCPERKGITLVKVKGFFSVTLESIIGVKEEC